MVGSVKRAVPEKPSQLERSLIGPAGEYYVLFRLHMQDMLASLAPRGSPTVDILVLNPDESVSATLQVKTRTRGADGGWHMSAKHEYIARSGLFYAFLDLEPIPYRTYIVPSQVIAKLLSKSHQVWLNTPGKHGRLHKEHDMRRVRPDYPFQVDGHPPGWTSTLTGGTCCRIEMSP